MTAAPFISFDCDFGATFDETVLWRDKATQVPIDLTLYHANMQLRTVPGDEIMLELNPENERIQLGGIDGTIRMMLKHGATEIVPRVYRTDLRLWIPAVDPEDDAVEFLFKGTFTINPTVTTAPVIEP